MWTDASTRTPLGSEYQNTAGGASAILVQKLRFYMLKNAAKILKKDKQNTPGHWITGGSVWTNQGFKTPGGPGLDGVALSLWVLPPGTPPAS